MAAGPDLNDLLVFAHIARAGSFVAAARETGLPKTTVSRRLQSLEARLGTRLLQRTTRRVSLTEAGRLMLAHAERIRDEAQQAEAALGRLLAAPRGRLVVTVPPLFGLYFLAPVLPQFLSRHAELRVDVRLTDEPVDPGAQGVDVAIRAGPLPSRRFGARALGHLTRRLYAAPTYLGRAGIPQRPADLAAHAILALRGEERRGRVQWVLATGRHRETVPVAAMLIANDAAFLLEAVLTGLGIAKLPEALCRVHVEAGRLRPVLAAWSGPPVTVSAVYPTRVGMPPKVRAFLDFLGDTFAATGPTGPRAAASAP